ncbi:hemin-degrading factor [Oceaniovalibus sp. ACAM 378]|uniref:hemin-degrading factor n=1 Tax=Oceaniovalibus sp. ACAM 378 TaxID=2599923 RepID=UPI0011D7EBBD|nr:ChuX/HutX family heme-like substrate-binding protein [Oceaniovalibus sp. ACAM 378]TYB86692.1 hemin-degrading factor [Oceaniovalibus sp. ACAM 378]
MTDTDSPTPNEIRAFRAQHASMRERDLADKLNISEAQLIAAYCGEGVVRVDSHPDKIIGAAQTLGEVMALTRNPSCVNEKVGVYDNYRSGAHASMVLTEDIDLRIFPSRWQYAYMVEKETDAGTRRSLQVFDAAGDAVHKIFLRDGSDVAAFDRAKAELCLEDQSQSIIVGAREPDETPKADLGKLDILHKEWARMTDTHQFMRLTSKLKMNRLGAYRIAGEPFARALAPASVDAMLQQVAANALEIMVFTGNRGCIQIHSGPIETLKSMGPWQNVLDPRFNLHLRLDHIAEVWAVDKPTQRGPAVSVEAFNADGGLIFQVFGVGKEGRDCRPAWGKLVANLEGLDAKVPA